MIIWERRKKCRVFRWSTWKIVDSAGFHCFELKKSDIFWTFYTVVRSDKKIFNGRQKPQIASKIFKTEVWSEKSPEVGKWKSKVGITQSSGGRHDLWIVGCSYNFDEVGNASTFRSIDLYDIFYTNQISYFFYAGLPTHIVPQVVLKNLSVVPILFPFLPENL